MKAQSFLLLDPLTTVAQILRRIQKTFHLQRKMSPLFLKRRNTFCSMFCETVWFGFVPSIRKVSYSQAMITTPIHQHYSRELIQFASRFSSWSAACVRNDSPHHRYTCGLPRWCFRTVYTRQLRYSVPSKLQSNRWLLTELAWVLWSIFEAFGRDDGLRISTYNWT